MLGLTDLAIGELPVEIGQHVGTDFLHGESSLYLCCAHFFQRRRPSLATLHVRVVPDLLTPCEPSLEQNAPP